MELEPNERDVWVTDAQRWICQIKGVLQCKIDLDPAGEIAGVHVVAGTEREPRYIVRDVESLLKARLEMDVYYKKIGVVQIVGNSGDVSSAPAPAAIAETADGGVPGPAGVTFHPPGPGEGEEAIGAATGNETRAPQRGPRRCPARAPLLSRLLSPFPPSWSPKA